MKEFKMGFTLAEVLIVLAVIGVVAALSLPTLISNIRDKVREHQTLVINRKINQGTEGMQVRGALLNNYSSTAEFINELSKDMKIISVCDSNHLTDCWPYENVIVSTSANDDEKVKVAKQKNGKTFKMEEGEWAEVMGVIFGNGTPMLLAYNKKCEVIDPDSTYKTDKKTGIGDTSKCIAGIYDLNGSKGPNKLGQDVIKFRANGFGVKDCYFQFYGECYSEPVPYTITDLNGSFPCNPGSESEIFEFIRNGQGKSDFPGDYTFFWYDRGGHKFHGDAGVFIQFTGQIQNVTAQKQIINETAYLICLEPIESSSSGSGSESDSYMGSDSGSGSSSY